MRRLLRKAQVRIAGVATVVVAVILGMTAVVAVLAQQDALTSSIDDRIRQRADDIVALVVSGSVPTTLAVGADDDAFAQLVTVDGTVVATSENLTGSPIVAEPPPAEDDEQLTTVELTPVDNDEFRLLSRRFDAAGTTYVLHVAASLDDVNESVRVLTATLALTLPAVLAIVAALIWVAVDRAHRKVENAHRRLERFVADASHELRSPLTSIRSELEVDLAHGDDTELRATHRSVLEDTMRLQRLVDGLLYLARSDEGATEIRHDVVDLDEIVLTESKALRERRRVAVDTSQVSGAQVTGGVDLLSRAVRNILDNAERHAASTVTVALGETDGHAMLSIADDGPGVPADQVARIFERFARSDDARDRDSGGAGLGLAITRDIVTRHSGTVTLEPTGHTGARFVIRLPLSSTRSV
jgi:signal transduction histidine kinase